MKKSLLFPLFLFFYITTFSQLASYHFAEEFYFVKEISTSKFKNKQFRYEIAVRSNPSDTLSKIRIYGIASSSQSGDRIKSDFKLESRKEQEWTIYTIVGNIRQDADKLLFYASVNGNGDFYFDDVNFYVEETRGRWTQLKIYNPSFEISEPDIFTGYSVSKRRAEGLQVDLSNKIYKTGTLSLNVKTFGNVPASNLVKQVVNQVPQTEKDLTGHREFVDVAPYLMLFPTKKESSSESPLLSKSQNQIKRTVRPN